MAMIPTSLATLGQIVSRLLEMYGLNADEMLRRHGVDPVVLSKADARGVKWSGPGIVGRGRGKFCFWPALEINCVRASCVRCAAD